MTSLSLKQLPGRFPGTGGIGAPPWISMAPLQLQKLYSCSPKIHGPIQGTVSYRRRRGPENIYKIRCISHSSSFRRTAKTVKIYLVSLYRLWDWIIQRNIFFSPDHTQRENVLTSWGNLLDDSVPDEWEMNYIIHYSAAIFGSAEAAAELYRWQSCDWWLFDEVTNIWVIFLYMTRSSFSLYTNSNP